MSKEFKENWAKHLVEDEFKFWFEWMKTKGIVWSEDYQYRVSDTSEVTEPVSMYLKTGNERILDVGSGPLTSIGKRYKGKKLNITACDALGKWFKELYNMYKVKPSVPVAQCEMENLTEKYKADSFHIVHCQNSLDQCYNPVQAIMEMITVVKPKGQILLFHQVNKARVENFKGVNQWNLYEREGDMRISGTGFDLSVGEFTADVATQTVHTANGYIFCCLEKK